jgi:hypothetical protein
MVDDESGNEDWAFYYDEPREYCDMILIKIWIF